MYWTQDETPADLRVPDDVVDVLFALECRQIPVDHAFAMREALCAAIPWLAEDPDVGIHDVHVAGSQNGWERPVRGTDSFIQPSRRTKLAIRVPKARVDRLLAELTGARLQVADCPLAIGLGKVRLLSKETTLFARHVVGAVNEDEEWFLARCAQDLARMDIRMRKALCGKEARLATPDGPIQARSLMVASLTVAESIRLQQRGLGSNRLLGCGIFIPHKGIDPVNRDG
jgi:CRISPR-associated protein Cas6